MNGKQQELISALLDNELPPGEQQRAVSALLESGPETLHKFGRYRLIGDVMRGESAVAALELAERVRRALRDEPTVLAPQGVPGRWLRPVAGLAVAASVAVAAIMVAPVLLTETEQVAPSTQLAADLPPPAPLGTLVAAQDRPAPTVATARAPARWQTIDPDVAERLNRLVVEHHEFGGRTGIHGPVPHIGFVSYDAR